MAPQVSVLMMIHNGEPWLREALTSLDAQTYQDTELLIADDASTDGTFALLTSAAASHPRMRWWQWESQRGVAASLNALIACAGAPLFARLDADDIAEPTRFAKQLAFLLAFPDVGLLGTGATIIDDEGQRMSEYRPPVTDADIRRALKTRNPFVHSSVMMRREVVLQVGGYDPSFPVAQDYELWVRMAKVTQMANLREPLVRRRLYAGQASRHQADRLRAEAIVRLKQGVTPVKQVLGLVAPPITQVLWVGAPLRPQQEG